MRQNFWNIENWELRDSRPLYDFNDNYLTDALCFNIGVFTDDNGNNNDIIRWVTRGEYNKFMKNSGAVVW